MNIFYLYLGCLIVGMGLVVLSFFSDHDTDADMDVDMDVDADLDADVAVDHDVDVDVANSVDFADALWMPVLSLRFWIFLVAFFGLTGTILHVFNLATWGVTLGTAIGAGVVSGYLVSRLVQKLRYEKVDSDIDPERDYVGRRGEVLLAIKPGDAGQVRMEAKGVFVDLPAEIDDGDGEIQRGSKVVVLSYGDGKVKVARFDHGDDH